MPHFVHRSAHSARTVVIAPIFSYLRLQSGGPAGPRDHLQSPIACFARLLDALTRAATVCARTRCLGLSGGGSVSCSCRCARRGARAPGSWTNSPRHSPFSDGVITYMFGTPRQKPCMLCAALCVRPPHSAIRARMMTLLTGYGHRPPPPSLCARQRGERSYHASRSLPQTVRACRQYGLVPPSVSGNAGPTERAIVRMKTAPEHGAALPGT
jgi:hypothetical protein